MKTKLRDELTSHPVACRGVWTVALLSAVLLAGCDDESVLLCSTFDTDGCYFEYLPETITFDPTSEYVEVVGILLSGAPYSGCDVPPTSETRHVFHVTDTWADLESYVPISVDEFMTRKQAGVSFSMTIPIGHHGTATIHARPWHNFQDPPPSLVYCSDNSIVGSYNIKLRCGHCGGPVCGDDICESGEDQESCAPDCALDAVCGDGLCETTEQTTCREDCACTNQGCDDWCAALITFMPPEYGLCHDDDTSGGRFGVCVCQYYAPPCDGTEPFCSRSDMVGEWAVVCDQSNSRQIFINCDSTCWDNHGVTGFCDIGGTEDCVCD